LDVAPDARRAASIYQDFKKIAEVIASGYGAKKTGDRTRLPEASGRGGSGVAGDILGESEKSLHFEIPQIVLLAADTGEFTLRFYPSFSIDVCFCCSLTKRELFEAAIMSKKDCGWGRRRRSLWLAIQRLVTITLLKTAHAPGSATNPQTRLSFCRLT
jgi:hypothetical protein